MTQEHWEALRNYEQQRLKSISELTENEMANIDQWLLNLNSTYEELHYPMSFRIHHATTYFQEEEKSWFEKVKFEIGDDWFCFCKMLKQFISSRLDIIIENEKKDHSKSPIAGMMQLEQIIHDKFIKYSGEDDPEKWLLQTIQRFKQYQLTSINQLQAIPFLLEDLAYLWYIKNQQLICSFESFSKLLLQQFSTNVLSTPENTSTLTTQLSATMAREIIKAPTYFYGSKDDVIDWLEKLEQRFKMANWNDEHKLRYISIHLLDDAYRWWIQASGRINSWSNFVDEIKQAFGSTKMKELAFEQLRCYKQTINQSITQYYDKVIELCRRIDPSMSDTMKLQYLMAGVKDSLKLHLALRDPQTTELFLSHARKIEDTLAIIKVNYDYMEQELHQVIQSNHQSTLSAMKTDPEVIRHQSNTCEQNPPRIPVPKDVKKVKYNDTSRFNSPNYNTPKQKSGACYKCGTPGHHYRDCTRSHFD